MDLSVIIPARNEEWLQKTIESVMSAARAETEVIAILDGYWPDVGLPDMPNVRLIHHTVPIGQRAATNEGVRLSNAKYVMKLDAHCMLDEGFDVKLMADIQHDWTVVPRMYNLHVFDWRCKKCGRRWYMGPDPKKCIKEGCDGTEFEKIVVWSPRLSKKADFMRFDNTLHFQYWKAARDRPENHGDICDLMCCIGACWMMERSRYWEIDGMDERHSSWGQMGVELACKTWLSGGRQIVNKKTWFAHMFRTQDGFGFPYPNPGVDTARKHSRWLWYGNNWKKAKYKLRYILDKFWPIPGWEESDRLSLDSFPVIGASNCVNAEEVKDAKVQQAIAGKPCDMRPPSSDSIQ